MLDLVKSDSKPLEAQKLQLYVLSTANRACLSLVMFEHYGSLKLSPSLLRHSASLLRLNALNRVSGISGASVSNQGSSILETPVEEVFGTSPPLDPSQRPALKNRGGLAGSSARSLQASNCESVNNESLDLDERDIYQHFARRSAFPQS